MNNWTRDQIAPMVEALMREELFPDDLAKLFGITISSARNFIRMFDAIQRKSEGQEREAPTRDSAFVLLKAGVSNAQLASTLGITRNAARIYRYEWKKTQPQEDPLLK